jgi:hypothetical protein
MADRSNYIDVFFRNGLKEFEVLPPPAVWENIRPVLRKREKSSNILRAAAMVAVLVTLTASTIWLTKRISRDFGGPVISLNQDVVPEGSYTDDINKNRAVTASVVQSPLPDNAIARLARVNHSVPDEPSNLKISSTGTFTSNFRESKLHTSESVRSLSNSVVKNSASREIGNLIVSHRSPLPENKINRWTISAMASPDYYSSIKDGNNDAATQLANSEKPVVSYSGGVGFSYKVNRRMSVQSGVIYSSIGQEVTGISSFSGFSNYSSAKGGSQFSIQTSNGLIVASNRNIFLRDDISGRILSNYTPDTFDPSKADLTYLNSSIVQNFNYLQIPVLFKYKAIDRKLDINFIGGLSYNMLVSNSAYTKVSGDKYSLGKTEGLSPVNFSSSLGLGFEYNLSGKVSLNLEPTFRYYLTPLGGLVGSSIHPYSFGVLSGLSYKF